jgi:hypothetical protein
VKIALGTLVIRAIRIAGKTGVDETTNSSAKPRKLLFLFTTYLQLLRAFFPDPL